MEIDEDLLSRNIIASASVDGLTVMVNGREVFRPWHSITAASATTVTHGDARIFVLAIVFDDQRTFVLAEIEAAWAQMVELLHTCLPGVEPFPSWAPKLRAEPGVATLFERDE